MREPSPLDRQLMDTALALAKRGRGGVEPNPMVGCVIAKGDRVIAQGWHERYGGPHAEPNALRTCAESPEGATAYVTLEPCCHRNKQTPPCVPRLIEAKVARVVVGCLDPNPDVAGKGVAELRAAGIQVDMGCCEAQAKQLIAPFFARMNYRRPYVTLKWAQSADAKVAGPGGRRMQISGEAASRAVHRLRAMSDAIMVGVQTVLTDDPMLTVRGVESAKRLVRVVLDTDLRTPVTSALARTTMDVPVRIYSSSVAADSERAAILRANGIEIFAASDSRGNGRLPLDHILRDLGGEKMTHVLVEPGPTLAQGFLESGLVDRLWVIRSPNRVDDPTAPAAMPVPETFVKTAEITLGPDTLTEYLNPQSAVFFAAEPSTDLRLPSS